MRRRPPRTGPSKNHSSTNPILAAFEALGFTLGRRLAGARKPRIEESPRPAPRRKQASKQLAAGKTSTTPRTAPDVNAKPRRAVRRPRRAEAAPPAVVVVTAKPPIIRRRAAVIPKPRPIGARAASSNVSAELASPPAATTPPPPERGERIQFQADGKLLDGEVVRVTLDGNIVVAPLPAGDRILVAPDELVRSAR